MEERDQNFEMLSMEIEALKMTLNDIEFKVRTIEIGQPTVIEIKVQPQELDHGMNIEVLSGIYKSVKQLPVIKAQIEVPIEYPSRHPPDIKFTGFYS